MKNCFTILLGLTLSVLANATGIGMKTEQFSAQNQRLLKATYWYPTHSQKTPELVFDNPAFYGIKVHKDAVPDTIKRPLVVMSHGYMGNYRNQSWLASYLVNHGYIVAAPNHPGTTSRNRDVKAGSELWRRPKDLTAVIDRLQANPKLAGKVDSKRIYAVGHSLGAWTVLALTGAKFDYSRFLHDCTINKGLAACEVNRSFKPTPDDLRKLAGDLGDKRIKAVITIDIGLARGFDPSSLVNIKTPTLLIAANEPNPRIPTELETQYLADHLPNHKMVKLEGAMHFSFLQACKPNAIQLLEEETKGDGIVCLDGDHTDRKQLHKKTEKLILDFLEQNAQ